MYILHPKNSINLKLKIMRSYYIFGVLIFLFMSSITKAENTEQNPFFMEWNTPHQTIPFELIKVEHYMPAIELGLKEAYAEVDAIINNPEEPTFENTILAMELSGKQLNKVTRVMFNLSGTMTSPELMACLREASPKLSEFSSYVSLNPKLFEKVKKLYNKRAELNLDPESLKLLEDSYLGFQRSGANLEGDDKIRYAEINAELSQLSLSFGDNVLNETNAYTLHITKEEDLAGLPPYVIEAADNLAKSNNKEGWVFSLQFPSFFPLLKYADNREIRKEIYYANATKANKDNEYNNQEVVKKITSLRLELANLLGFNSYADFVLDRRMAKSAETVNNFINELHLASKPKAIEDYEEVKAFAKKLGFEGELKNWDWSYYTEKLKEEKFGFKEDDIKPYFQLEKVTEGVFSLFNKLYGITFKANPEIQVYHEDVKVFEVYGADNSFLGVLYQDFHPRASKRAGAWSNDFRPQSNVNGEFITPQVYIVGNFTKPTETTPALITHNEVQTYLHEMGHALHGLFSNVTYESMAGTNVYWDFVELPSMVHENWAYEKEWLDTFVVHYKTGEKIPNELLGKLIEAKNFQSATGSERQLSLGMCDMAWHSITKPVTESVKDFESEAMSSTSLFPRIEETSTSTAFSHIFSGGYAAGYYSYKWGEVLDADAFAYFKEKGIFSKEVAGKFRKEVLSKGGTKHPMELYVNFRGQEPSIDGLLERSGLK